MAAFQWWWERGSTWVPNSSWIGDPETADLLLHVRTAPDGQSLAAGAVAVDHKTYHLRAFELEYKSIYFEARLSSTWLPPRPEDAPAPHHELVEHLDAHELQPFHELLQLLDSDHVPRALTTEQLLACLRLADRYQVTYCTDSLVERLAQKIHKTVLKTVFNASIMEQVWSLPAGILHRPRFAMVRRACKPWVVQRYRDAPAVARSDALRKEFCTLPFEVVLDWASWDGLVRDARVQLLSAWVRAQALRPSAQQLDQLAGRVGVLPTQAGTLEWWQLCPDELP